MNGFDICVLGVDLATANNMTQVKALRHTKLTFLWFNFESCFLKPCQHCIQVVKVVFPGSAEDDNVIYVCFCKLM